MTTCARFPLCHCYVFNDKGEVVPWEGFVGYWRSLAHVCEHEDCRWPKCQVDKSCAPLTPGDGFAECAHPMEVNPIGKQDA